MSARPVFHAEIGAFFTNLRESKGWTQRQAEDIAERRKITALTRQVLWRLEKGKTKNLDPKILRAIADLYDMPYEDLVVRWTAYQYGVSVHAGGRDLPDHADRGSFSAARSHAQHGEPSDADAITARLLDHSIRAREALAKELKDVALRLIDIANRDDLDRQGQTAPATGSARRRHRGGRR